MNDQPQGDTDEGLVDAVPPRRRLRRPGTATEQGTLRQQGSPPEARPSQRAALRAVPAPQHAPAAREAASVAAAGAAAGSSAPVGEELPTAVNELLVLLQGRWPQSDLQVVCRAYRLAEEAHRGQTRLSGEPYISHPMAVARILAELGLDPVAAAAALLHDVLEDTEVSEDRIRREVGADVLRLVRGLTKVEQVEKAKAQIGRGEDPSDQAPPHADTAGRAALAEAVQRRRRARRDASRAASRPEPALESETGRRRARHAAEEAEAESLRRMLMSATVDVRVLLIKLADRLHNMRTACWLPQDRQRHLAEQTEQIYAPLADRLGLWQVKTELEDLSLQILEPKVYAAIESMVARDLEETEHYLGAAIHELDEALRRQGLRGEVSGRVKHYASIRNKLRRLEAQPEEIGEALQEVRDILALRVVLDDNDTNQCYAALGIVHTIWQPIEGTVDDYIARPKSNNYQSLHTTVVGPEERVLEVQIRTAMMHQIAELGVAAHWAYKQQSRPDRGGLEAVRNLRQRLDQVIEIETDAQEFVDRVVGDVLSAQVRILTPKGHILELPSGATPIDVAYAIHTDVGHRCRGAKVDGRLVALNTQLRTGQRVEILTAKGPAGPSRDWLNPDLGYTATMLARSRIRQWFRRQERSAAVAAGRQILERQLRRLGLTRTRHDTVARLFGYREVDEFYLALGRAVIAPEAVSQRLVERESDRRSAQAAAPPASVVPGTPTLPVTSTSAIAAGGSAIATRVARCCAPLPGDAVIGYVTRGRGITLHRDGCANIRLLRQREPQRFVSIAWQADRQQGHPVKLRIVAYDRAGLVRDISQIVANYGVSMDSVTAVANPVDGTATVTAVVRLQSLGLLVALLDRLETVENVIDVRRAP